MTIRKRVCFFFGGGCSRGSICFISSVELNAIETQNVGTFVFGVYSYHVSTYWALKKDA